MLEQAEAYKTRVVKAAQGETSRFNQILAEYQLAPEVTRERLYIDALESVMSRSPKVLIDIDNGSNLLFLPLDQLLARGGRDTNFVRDGQSDDVTQRSLFDEF